jgi:mitotic spindle assembly checkpoint protein MAD2
MRCLCLLRRGVPVPLWTHEFRIPNPVRSPERIPCVRACRACVRSYLGYAVNSILFQRGIYAQDLFKPVKKYEMQLMLTSDRELQVYLSQILKQVTTWLMKSKVKQLTLVVSGIDSQEVLERWVFDVKQDDSSER